MELAADLVDVGTINNNITVNSDWKEQQGCSQTTNVLQLESVSDGSVSQEIIETDSNPHDSGHQVLQQDLGDMAVSDFKSDSVTSALLQNRLQTTNLSQLESQSVDSVPQEINETGGSLHDSDHVFMVKVVDNVRVPSYSEMEIVATVKGCTLSQGSCYVLENNLHNSDVIVARALVIPDEFVPVRLLNPTDKPIACSHYVRDF